MKKYSRYHNVPSIDFNMIMIKVCYSGLHMKTLVQKMGLKVDDSTEVFSLESFNKYLACVFTVTEWGRSRQNLHIVEWRKWFYFPFSSAVHSHGSHLTASLTGLGQVTGPAVIAVSMALSDWASKYRVSCDQSSMEKCHRKWGSNINTSVPHSKATVNDLGSF